MTPMLGTGKRMKILQRKKKWVGYDKKGNVTIIASTRRLIENHMKEREQNEQDATKSE